MSLLLAGVALLVLCVAPAALAAVWLMARPSRAIIGAPPPGQGMRLSIVSATGRSLAAWFVEGTRARGAILLVHGIRADRRVLARRMNFLNQAGFAVLAIDLQAHGESQGDKITFGQLESRDVAAAILWLRRTCPGEKIGAIGISLGGAALLLAPEIGLTDAIVLESVFPDIERAIANRLNAVFGPLGPVIAPPFIAIAQWVTGLDIRDLRPIEALKASQNPVLIMSGVEDKFTTIEETRDMFDVAGAPKALWEVEGAAHVDLSEFAGPDYRRRVLGFFESSLKRTSPCA